MSWLSGRYTPVGTNNILASLRGLFECPEVAAELTFNPSGLLANLRTPRHDKIPSVYSADEVSAALSTVDRDTDHGRALYLVIVLAAVYGLRSGDIRGLRIDDIDFRANSIGIVQHKTGAPLALPLVEAVKLPLLDYMANTRRECPYREVMIKHRGAAEPYTHLGNYSSDLRHAFESSGVELRGRKAGLHSLRHSLATGLLGSGVPANEISAVLGHRSLRSTQDYVWSDVEHLRIAALEV
jgi:integrase